MKFYKYHALGNDYLVLDPADLPNPLKPEQIQRICHRHFGIGSDGILVGRPESIAGEFSLRIFNPDGSEAEKSGNGLRIFARYLWDRGLVGESPFTILTAGGKVIATVDENGHEITVEMGKVSFESKSIPVTGPSREVIDETMRIEGKDFKYCAVSIGNPHCVLARKVLSEAETRHYGPLLENAPCFPRRTNVQFMRILIAVTSKFKYGSVAQDTRLLQVAAVARRRQLLINWDCVIPQSTFTCLAGSLILRFHPISSSP